MNFIPLPCRSYVALLSVVIISTLLTVIIISSSQLLFFVHTSLLEEESHQTAMLQAVSCARLALQSLSLDTSRFKNKIPTTVYVSAHETCEVQGVSATNTTIEMSISSMANYSFAQIHFAASRTSTSSNFTLTSMSPETN